MSNKLEEVIKYLEGYIAENAEKVKEAEDDYEALYDGSYLDSFDKGWNRGRIVGRDDMANTILNMLK